MPARPSHDRPAAPAGPVLAGCAGRTRTVGRFAASTAPGVGPTSGTTPAAVRDRHRPAPTCSRCTGRSAACRPAAGHIGHAAGGAHSRARTLRKWRSFPSRCAPGCGASDVRWSLAGRWASHAAAARPAVARRYGAPAARLSPAAPSDAWATRQYVEHTLRTGDTAVGTVRVGAWTAPMSWIALTHCADPAPIPVKPALTSCPQELSGYESPAGPPPPFAAPLRCALTSG